MAHDRIRHVKDYFHQLTKFSPIVGIFGHRQVGKSTFMATQVREYSTLDDVDQALLANENPKTFIQGRALPFGIDECQIEPKLFPTLKERVRIHKRPGQFILSGSVRFTSRKAIRESLAGRLAFLEILPFTISEIHEEPLPDTVLKLLQLSRFSSPNFEHIRPYSELAKMKKYFHHYMAFGGLPGLCFIRNEQLRTNRLKQLLELIIDRDLRMVIDTKLSVKVLLDYLGALAEKAWTPYNAAEITKKFKFSPATQKRLLYAFESIFLIRRLPVIGRKSDIILIEDQFEELALSQHKLGTNERIQGAIYRNIRTQWMSRLSEIDRIESYMTLDGAKISLVISGKGNTLGLKLIQGETPNLSEIRSVTGFLKRFSNSKIIYLSPDVIRPSVIDDRSLLVSLYAIL